MARGYDGASASANEDLPWILIDLGILTSNDPVMSDGSVGFSAVAGGAGAGAGAGAWDISRCPLSTEAWIS